MNTEVDQQSIPDRLENAILAALEIHPKSVWLCASELEAKQFESSISEWLNNSGMVGHPTWVLTSLGNEIDQFKDASKGHLFVGGRFDGMDFNGDECRLVIFTTLPRSINLQEEFLTAYLRDAGFMLRRLNQRIVQGLGRCNRGSNDFGIYVLADPRFATHFGRESQRLGLPKNIVAEIDMAEDQAGLSIDELADTVKSFLSGHFGEYDQKLSAYLDAIPGSLPLGEIDSDTATEEVNGWTEIFQFQNYAAAEKQFETCSAKATKANIRELGAFFQYLQAKAMFLMARQQDSRATSFAMDCLRSAIDRGGHSSWFNRLRTSLNRYNVANKKRTTVLHPVEYPELVVQSFDDLLEGVGRTGTRFQKWVQRTSEQLSSTNHDEFLEGMDHLGSILGYKAARPRYGASTDCIWRGVFGNTREIVTIEAKIEQAQGARIWARDVGQVYVQLARAREQFANRGFTVRAVIVSHIRELDSAAQSSLGEIRILEKDAILLLCSKILETLAEYRRNWSLYDLTSRQVAAEQVIPKLPPEGWLSRALGENGPVINAPMLLAEWPT